MSANYMAQVLVLVQRVDNKALTPAEGEMVETLQAAAQAAVVAEMAKHDQHQLSNVIKKRVDF